LCVMHFTGDFELYVSLLFVLYNRDHLTFSKEVDS
jgi:hypothetical protein